jgi:predicted metal-dependent hydrolase
MRSLRVGKLDIPYELRRSLTASERRITVTPGAVEVVALSTDDDAAIDGFLQRKKRWVYDNVRELEAITSNRAAVPNFMTGSKIPFRGRFMPLTVRRTNGPAIEITFRNGFFVDIPSDVDTEAFDVVIASELKLWLKRRVRRDVTEVVKDYEARFGLKPRGVRVAGLQTGWGTCGAEGTVHISWLLVFAPKRVLEYVVVHELAHLRHRTHGKAFWDYLALLLPDFERSKAWLDANQAILDDGFLVVK